MTMIAGQTVAANIVLKNIGTKAWDANTKLGTTQPRDRASAFVAPGWESASRAAHVTGTVAPNATFKFAFNFHAPAKAGSYHEFFSLVEEKVAWFGDAGQGGPADNVIEANIEVVLPNYSGAFVAQSFPGADKAAVMLGVGQSVDGWVDLKNVGSQPWKAGVTKLAPTPRDKPSAVGGDGWLSPTRVSTVAADVAPGAVGRFPVKLTGSAVGDYTQTFALVEDGKVWFSDPSNGGGPADDYIKVHVQVTDTPQPPPTDDGGALADMGSDGTDDAGDGSGGGSGDGTGDGTGAGGNGDTGGDGSPAPRGKGCSMAGAGAGGDFTVALPLLFAGAGLFARRRRRPARG